MANQKDYKAISEIIRGLVDIGKFSPVWMCNNPKELIRQLADYFEREDKRNKSLKEIENMVLSGQVPFNREQFLKECGVK